MNIILEVVEGPETGRRVTIPDGQSCLIGRETGDLVLGGDLYLSGRHFLVANEGSSASLTDLNSRNHVFVNEAQVTVDVPVPLTDGCQIRAGTQTVFSVRYEVDAARRPPTPATKSKSAPPPVQPAPKPNPSPISDDSVGEGGNFEFDPVKDSSSGTAEHSNQEPSLPPIEDDHSPFTQSVVLDTPQLPAEPAKPTRQKPTRQKPTGQKPAGSEPEPSPNKASQTTSEQTSKTTSEPGAKANFDRRPTPESNDERSESVFSESLKLDEPPSGPVTSRPQPKTGSSKTSKDAPSSIYVPGQLTTKPAKQPAVREPIAASSDLPEAEYEKLIDKPGLIVLGGGTAEGGAELAVRLLGALKQIGPLVCLSHDLAAQETVSESEEPQTDSRKADNKEAVKEDQSAATQSADPQSAAPQSAAPQSAAPQPGGNLELTPPGRESPKPGGNLELEPAAAAPLQLIPLFHWLPDDVAMVAGPVMISEAKLTESGATASKDLLAEQWGQNLILWFAGSDPQAIMAHLKSLVRTDPRTGAQSEGVFGICWPNVLAAVFDGQDARSVARIFGDAVEAVLFEDPDLEYGWKLASRTDLSEALSSQGFVQSVEKSSSVE